MPARPPWARPSQRGPHTAMRRPVLPARAAADAAPTAPLPPYTLPAPPLVVADAATLKTALDRLAPPNGGSTHPNGWHPVGLDAEWRPETERGARHPVAVLQLACRSASFVVDTHALCGVAPPGEAAAPPTEEQRACAVALAAGLAALANMEGVVLVGHSLKGDVARLARTLATVLAEGGEGADFPVPPVDVTAVDVASLARAAEAAATPWHPHRARSLAFLVETRLQMRLPHKAASHGGATIAAGGRVTLSDWAARPLTQAQVEYSAQDAHAPVSLFDALTEAEPKLVATPAARAAVSGGVRRLWAVDGKARGGSAERPPRADGDDQRPGAPSPHPPHTTSRPPPAHELPLASVDALLAAHLGRPLPAGGRDAVVRIAAGMPPTGAPVPTTRGGVIALADAALLLVNLDLDGRGPYANALKADDDADRAVRVTWWPASPHDRPDSPLLARLLDDTEPTMLFARLRRGRGVGGSPFVLLGRVDAPRVEWGADGRAGRFEWKCVDLGRAVERGGCLVGALLEAGRWEEEAVARLF